MAILLHVSSLAGPLCSVRCEASWTGRQLKEAIEVETKWSELACTQTLAIGPRVVEDDDILGEDAKEGVEVSVGRSSLPAFVLAAPRDAQSWALALQGYPSRGFPVLLEAREAYVFDGSGKELWDDIDQAYRKEMEERRHMYHPREIELRHLPLEKDMLLTWVPWKAIAGIDPEEVSCVLALQASCGWVGDSMSWISSIAVLQDGALIAITAKIWEACSGCNYESHIVSGLLRVQNLEELAARAPGFYEAMTLPLSHERHSQPEAGATEPLGRGRSWIGDIGMAWTTGARLRNWQEAHGGEPKVRGWADFQLPSKRFTDAWKMPDAFSELITRSVRSGQLARKRWEEAARDILQDKTKTFGQMVDDFEAELGSEFFEPPELRAGLDRLRADAAKAANPKEFEYFLLDVNGSLGRHLFRDFAFGVNQTSIFYDELKSEDAKP